MSLSRASTAASWHWRIRRRAAPRDPAIAGFSWGWALKKPVMCPGTNAESPLLAGTPRDVTLGRVVGLSAAATKPDRSSATRPTWSGILRLRSRSGPKSAARSGGSRPTSASANSNAGWRSGLKSEFDLGDAAVSIDEQGRATVVAAPPFSGLSKRVGDNRHAVSVDALLPTGLARNDEVTVLTEDARSGNRRRARSTTSADETPAETPTEPEIADSEAPPTPVQAPTTDGGEGRLTVAVTRTDVQPLLRSAQPKVVVDPAGPTGSTTRLPAPAGRKPVPAAYSSRRRPADGRRSGTLTFGRPTTLPSSPAGRRTAGRSRHAATQSSKPATNCTRLAAAPTSTPSRRRSHDAARPDTGRTIGANLQLGKCHDRWSKALSGSSPLRSSPRRRLVLSPSSTAGTSVNASDGLPVLFGCCGRPRYRSDDRAREVILGDVDVLSAGAVAERRRSSLAVFAQEGARGRLAVEVFAATAGGHQRRRERDRSDRRPRHVVRLPEDIDDIIGCDPMPDESKVTVANGGHFPRRLTKDELRDRLVARLKTDYGVGHVDVELADDGTVDYLAVGSRAAGIGPTLPPSTNAVAIQADPAHAASAGDLVQVWEQAPAKRVLTGELRGDADDCGNGRYRRRRHAET